MTAYEDLLPQLLVEAPGAPEPFLISALARAARAFFRDTLAWREEFAGVAQAREVLPAAPADTALVDVVSVTRDDGARVLPRAPNRLDVELPQWRTQTGPPQYYHRVQGEWVRLVPYPVPASGTVTLILAVAPRLTATHLPDHLALEHEQALVDGALYEVLAVNRAWRDLPRAAAHRTDFERAKDLAKSRADLGHQHGGGGVVAYGGL